MLLAHTGLSSDFFICRREVLIALLAVLLLYFALKKQIAEIKVERISQKPRLRQFWPFLPSRFL